MFVCLFVCCCCCCLWFVVCCFSLFVVCCLWFTAPDGLLHLDAVRLDVTTGRHLPMRAVRAMAVGTGSRGLGSNRGSGRVSWLLFSLNNSCFVGHRSQLPLSGSRRLSWQAGLGLGRAGVGAESREPGCALAVSGSWSLSSFSVRSHHRIKNKQKGLLYSFPDLCPVYSGASSGSGRATPGRCLLGFLGGLCTGRQRVKGDPCGCRHAMGCSKKEN